LEETVVGVNDNDVEGALEEPPSTNEIAEVGVIEKQVPEETVPEAPVPEETVPEAPVPEETVPEAPVPEEDWKILLMWNKLRLQPNPSNQPLRRAFQLLLKRIG
jgi:hypothetical protein